MALVEVTEKGVSIRKASTDYNVPKSTLADYVKRKREGKVDSEEFKLASYVMSQQMERDLADYLLKCSDMFYGLTTALAKRVAYEYAIANNVDVPPSWRRNKSAGREWLTGFLERRGNLSLRSPEATSLARIASFNRTNVGIFQKKLEEVLSRYGFQKSSIYNLGETGCTTLQDLPRVIGRELVTVVGIVCADGNALPPIFIFPRVRFDEARMMNGVPNSCLGLASPTGWMTSDNFLSVLGHFALHTKCSKDHKVLLIMNNHESLLSVEGINFARDNGIVILTLPPHTSYKLQPLDVSIFGPFKTFYNQGLNEWMLEHPGRVDTIYDIAPIMCNAWDKAATPVHAKSGFRNTGICPFSTTVFSVEDFLDMPALSAATQPDLETTQGSSTSVRSQEASTSHIVSSKPSPTKSEHLRPFPEAPARMETTRGRKRGKCMIATDTPEKNELEERQCRPKRSKVTMKIKFVGAKEVQSSDEEDLTAEKRLAEELRRSSDEFDESEDIDEESEGIDEESKDIIPSFVDKKPEVDDFVLIALDPVKGHKVHFVGKLLSSIDEDGDFEVSFLRKSNKGKEDNFYFPSEVDEATISRNFIIGVLPAPISQSTKRRERYFNFGFSFSGYKMR